jgi:hypothetical protein
MTMLTKTKAALAAAIILGTASVTLAEPAGVPETRFPAEATSQSAPVYEGRNVAAVGAPHAAMPRNSAEQKALFDRANGNIHN